MSETRCAKTTVLVALLVGAIGVTPAVASPLGNVATHLEFLDQAVTAGEDRIQATHPDALNATFREIGGGLLVHAFFGGTELAKANLGDYAQSCNSINRNAVVVRAYIDSDGDLALEAWYPGNYDRTRFGLFLKAFNDEAVRLVQDYVTNHGDFVE